MRYSQAGSTLRVSTGHVMFQTRRVRTRPAPTPRDDAAVDSSPSCAKGRGFFDGLYLVGVCAAVLMVSGCASVPKGPLDGGGLRNFDVVTTGIYRGAEPTPDGYRRLMSLGIRTVIDLRTTMERSISGIESGGLVGNLGMTEVQVPLNGFLAPSMEQAGRVLGMLNNSALEPIYLHCERGADRTGTMIAIFRIEHDCWSPEKAIAEAQGHGMAWFEYGMRAFIRKYAASHTLADCSKSGH